MTNKTEEGSAALNMCAPAAIDPTNCGMFISEGQAESFLRNYFKESGHDSTDPHHIYGHTFGLENVRSLITKIDEYNKIPSPLDEKITGIRVYYGSSVRTHVEYPRTVMQRDVFFIPVRKDGFDLHDIHKQLPGDDIILGEGRPCPNECKLTFLDKKK